MIRLAPLMVGCRNCGAPPGKPCEEWHIAGRQSRMVPREPHEERHKDADRASELLDDRLSDGEMAVSG